MDTRKCTFTRSWTHNGLTVIDNLDCGFAHLYPLPTPEELSRIYTEEFGGKVRDGFAKKKEADARYWSRSFERRALAYEAELPARADDSPRRILDVGCGTGNTLEFFRSKCWDVFGIEPSVHFHEGLDSAQIPYIGKLLEDCSEDDYSKIGVFDVVNVALVLEHILDPVVFLKNLLPLLKPGGILTIEVPNDFNLLQEIAVENHDLHRWWINRLHINYFSFESLERLLSDIGFSQFTRDAQFPMEMFLLFGDNYINEPTLGKEAHRRRVAFEDAFYKSGRVEELRKIYNTFAELGLGRTAIVHARR